jgi:hypothetical protein
VASPAWAGWTATTTTGAAAATEATATTASPTQVEDLRNEFLGLALYE